MSTKNKTTKKTTTPTKSKTPEDKQDSRSVSPKKAYALVDSDNQVDFFNTKEEVLEALNERIGHFYMEENETEEEVIDDIRNEFNVIEYVSIMHQIEITAPKPPTAKFVKDAVFAKKKK